MYSLYAFGRMIADHVRMGAYAGALQRCIKPDSVVVDIGTGTGIFALLACRYGARKVYAIDPNDLIVVARRLARQNGFEDRIEFIHDLSTKVSLPEQADVIVSDLRGALPLYGAHIPSIIDARQRFLKPGGTLLPQKDTLMISLVSAGSTYNRIVGPWKSRKFKLDMKPAISSAVNSLQGVRLRPAQILVEPVAWAEIDYTRANTPHAQRTIEFSIKEGQRSNGLGMWFETQVFDNFSYSSGPFSPQTVYAQMFLPFERPLLLHANDKVVVEIAANLVGKDYVWRWKTAHYRDGVRQAAAQFDQSSFYGAPIIPERLRKKSDHWAPTVNQEGRIDRAIVDMMDGTKSLLEIATVIHGLYPQEFPAEADALERVKDLSERYSQ
jgi:protein arginine N-methyltransferase 1